MAGLHRTRRLAAAGATSLLLAATGGVAASADGHLTEVASGLNNPRQLAFSPRGELYVAEAGVAGSQDCQEHPEFGEVCLGLTGSVARVNADGSVTRVIDGLPSVGSPGDATGPSDITFTGNHQFAVTIGLGGSLEYRDGYGADGDLLGTVVTGDLRHYDGLDSLTMAFDVVGYEASANPDGTDIDSNGTGIARWGNRWVVADAGGNSIVSSRDGGSTLGVLDPVPTTQPFPFPGFPADAVPTDVVRGPDGAWYVSQLVGFPFEQGSSTIWRLVPGHAPTAWATGLTNVTSLAFADDGTLYAVELASNGLLSGPIGALVEVTPGADSHDVVAGGLFAPYGVAIRDGSAYVTTGSVLPGGGAVVRIAL